MTNELLQVCEKLRDDLLMRAEIASDGTRVVDVSHGIWCEFKEAIDNARYKKPRFQATRENLEKIAQSSEQVGTSCIEEFVESTEE